MNRMFRQRRANASSSFLVLATAFFLQACGTEEEAGVAGEDALTGTDAEVDVEIELSGSVGDGPIVGASLAVFANDGSLISEALSDDTASYGIQLKTKGKYFPLTIRSNGGIDLATNAAPGFEMVSVATAPRNRVTTNINPFTTLAVSAARQMSGGLTKTNVSVAVDSVMRSFNPGMTSAMSTDPIATPVDDFNLAEIVKGSEAVAETFRRVHGALGDDSLSLDEVIASIAGDLTDGVLDGAGSIQADRRVSALTVVASAQVMVESMTNQLRVNGEDVTPVLDGIVRELATRADIPLTGSRPVTASMIEQARRGIDAARAMGDSAALTSLRDALDVVTPGMSASAAAGVLPAETVDGLTGSLNTLASASDADIAAVLAGQPSDDTDQPGDSEPPVNTPPEIVGAPSLSITVGEFYDFSPGATDADGDGLSFSIVGRPNWLSFNMVSGRLSGTPSAADVGTSGPIEISVSDGAAAASLAPFSIVVVAAPPPVDPPVVNSPPVIAGSPGQAVEAGSSYSFRPTASDADGDSLQYAVSGRPSWASFSAFNGRLFGTPSASDVGTSGPIVISVSDGTDTTSLPAFTITVSAVQPPPNAAPQISGTPATAVNAGTTFNFQPVSSDADGDSLTFMVSGRPAWAAFNSATGRLIGTPSVSDVGSHGPVSISVTDGQDTAVLPAFTIVVIDVSTPVNNPPSISGAPSLSVSAGSAYSFTPAATDPDGDALTFSISGRPSWASFNAATGRLSGTPSGSDAGNYGPIVISVSDGTDSAALSPFTIGVQSATLGSATLSWVPPSQNTDGSPLTDLSGYTIAWGTQSGNLSNSVTVMNAGITTYVVDQLAPGTYYFALRAVNSSGVESALSNEASKTVN